jgi:hypothetical protein
MNNLFRFATMVFLAALATAAAAAQSANPDAATMQEILSEVRQLRRTVQTTLSLGPRMQILLQRAQLEDMRAGLKMITGNGPDQQLRARESELSNSLDTEQAALNDLNEKLDALERQLEAVAAAR